ncbi:hypothetical protein Pmani_031028 [Petrolisthes manimaculis]|uniref:Uncharacterized protein n=1 Tax=Petrolisthes manimaculis TaxID=1843537 RepID=A0AAE1TVA4_9EUCA|nr:hypothetical protein Pmani_031028 [Petrolisthes manimaculis]
MVRTTKEDKWVLTRMIHEKQQVRSGLVWSGLVSGRPEQRKGKGRKSEKKRREGKRRTVYDSCWLESEVIRHNKGATPSIPSFSPHKLAQDDLP